MLHVLVWWADVSCDCQVWDNDRQACRCNIRCTAQWSWSNWLQLPTASVLSTFSVIASVDSRTAVSHNLYGGPKTLYSRDIHTASDRWHRMTFHWHKLTSGLTAKNNTLWSNSSALLILPIFSKSNFSCQSAVNIFGQPFVKWFAVWYQTVVLSVCPVCNIGVL